MYGADGGCLLALPVGAQIDVTMKIRDENSHDWDAVYEVVTSAFGQSAEANLVRELREAGDSVISLVAEEESQIVGHVLLSRMDAPFPSLALAPVSVIPTRQHSGIGSALIENAVNRARSEGWAAIFVLGDPKYYERFGFGREAAAGFTSPYAGHHFMVIKLSAPLPATTGELHHAAAFDALD
jgi:putative acetyltransferase